LKTECLEENVTIMQPTAATTDTLQAQKEEFFGILLPTSCTIKSKPQGILHKPLKHSNAIVKSLLKGLENRFQDELPLNHVVANKIMSTNAHSFFKLL
jgi:hypothetical protein